MHEASMNCDVTVFVINAISLIFAFLGIKVGRFDVLFCITCLFIECSTATLRVVRAIPLIFILTSSRNGLMSCFASLVFSLVALGYIGLDAMRF